MTIYLSLILIIGCLIFVDSSNTLNNHNFKQTIIGNYKKKSNIKTFYDKYINSGFILIILIIFFSFFRSINVGVDLKNYKYYYDYFRTFGSHAFIRPCFDYAIGFKLFTFICTCLRLPFSLYLLIITSFFWITIWIFIRTFSQNNLISLLIIISVGLLEQSFCLLRQIVALGFLIWSLYFLFKNSYFAFFFFVLLASMFHETALCFIVIILFKVLKINFKNLILFSLMCFFLAIFFDPLSKFMELIFKINYFELYRNISSTTLLNWIILICMFFAFIFLYLYYAKQKNVSKSIQISMWMFAFVVLIKFLSLIYNIEIFQRLLIYFFFSLALIIPDLINSLVLKYNKLSYFKVAFSILVFIVFSIYFIYNLATKDLCGCVPFEFRF